MAQVAAPQLRSGGCGIDHGVGYVSWRQRPSRSPSMTAATACSQVQVRGRSCEGVSLIVRTASGERTIDGSNILVAAGRIPNTADGLENAGVAGRARLCPRQERLETSAPDVWALDECAGSPQFTHISEGDFRIVTENLAGGKRSTRDRLVPYCVFADPPLAHVGLSERDAERQGVAMRVAKLPMSGVLRAQAIDRRDAGLHEGPRDRRGDGGDADSDAGGPAFYAAARCRSRPSDLCRGPRPAALASTAPRSAAGRGLPISASSPGLTGRSSNGRRSGHWMPAFLPSPERSSHHPRSDAANAPVERL